MIVGWRQGCSEILRIARREGILARSPASIEALEPVRDAAYIGEQLALKPGVRKLFHRLDGWLVRRIWSHRHRKWRCCGWKTLPRSQLYGEYGLVNLVAMIPSLATRRTASS